MEENEREGEGGRGRTWGGKEGDVSVCLSIGRFFFPQETTEAMMMAIAHWH